MGNINKNGEFFPDVNKQWEDSYTTAGPDSNIWVDKSGFYEDWAKKLQELQQQQYQQTLHPNMDGVVARLEKIELTLETLLSMMKLILSTQIETELKNKVEDKKKTQEEVS